jgi:hypothetical protein
MIQLIEFRHGIIHRFEFDYDPDLHGLEELLDLALITIETFIDHLEESRGLQIWGTTPWRPRLANPQKMMRALERVRWR